MLIAMREDQRDGERRERKDAHLVLDEPDGGKENTPELPEDSVSPIFERVGGLNL